MKIISEIINMNDLGYYTYLEDLNIFKCKDDEVVSTIYQMKELIKIINILENNNVNYTVDVNQNIIL